MSIKQGMNTIKGHCIRWSMPLLAVLGIVAVFVGAMHLIILLRLESAGPLHSDALLYMEVGKAILHGQIPYLDAFESKPPGIFLLSALSLFLKGSGKFASLVQVLGFALLPVLFTTWGIIRTRNQPWNVRIALSCVAASSGLLLSLYAERFAGTLQAEGFGGIYGALYGLIVIWLRNRWNWKGTVLASIALLASIGMKEPFFLSTLAAAILLSRSKKEFLHTFIIPLLVAIGGGLIILLFMGSLRAYLGIYLPTMLSLRIFADIIDPLWLRGMEWHQFLPVTKDFTVPLFELLLGILWISAPFLRQKKTKVVAAIVCCLSSVATLIVMYSAFFAYRILTLTEFSFRFDIAAFRLIMLWAALALIVWMVLLVLLSRIERDLFRQMVLCIAALCLANLSVGVGGTYYMQHFVFILPFFAALFLMVIDRFAEERSSVFFFGVATFILLALLTVRHDSVHAENLRNYVAKRAELQQQTQALDALLDRCAYDAFYAVGYRFPFAQHHIVGPVMGLQRYLSDSHPLIVQTRQNIEDRADLIIVSEGETLDAWIEDMLSKRFTEKLPLCSQPIDSLETYRLYVRI